MHYQQTRAQSGDFLRLAVGYMGRQQASLDPASYTLWYEHAAGLNPPLSRILEQRLNTQIPLTDADVAHLYAIHIASRDAQAVARIHERLTVLLRETSEVISQTGTHANQFSQSLEDHTERLSRPDAPDSIQGVLSELLTETRNMSAVNLTLSRQLDTRAREIQTLTQRLERAEAAALNDPLTGLLNRRGIEQAFRDLSAQTGGVDAVALLIADVDRFKEINDTYGHPVLRGIGQVLRARIKGADFAARLGGDEFGILLPNTALKGALVLAEQIRAAVSQARLRRVTSDQPIAQVSVSVGVAHAAGTTSLDKLLAGADAALYKAKREGRNRVQAAGPST
jgi:diguanylate cyclase